MQTSHANRSGARPTATLGLITVTVALAAASVLALVPGEAAFAEDATRQSVPLTGPVTRLEVRGGLDFVLIQGDAPGLVLEGDKRAVDRVTTRLQNGVLEITQRGRSEGGSEKLVATLTLAHLSEIRLSGASDLRCKRWATHEPLTLHVDGAADGHLDGLDVPSFKLEASGSSDIEVSGSAAQQDIHIAGSGEYSAANLKTETTALVVSGAAEATVWATQRLDLDVGGAADVKYYGHPQLSRRVAGMASVEAAGDKP